MRFVILVVGCVLLTLLPSASAATLYVGVGQSYTTIGAALSDAVDGDVIFVYNGTYVENLAITKNVSIVGEDAGSTIVLSPSASSFTVVLDGAGACLENLTITGATSSSGVRVNANNITISGCTVSGNYDGIYLVGADYTTIVNCNLENNTHWALRIQYNSIHNTISNNTIKGGDNGIYIREGGANTDTHDTISNNTISGCVGSGVYVENAQHNTLLHNDISACKFGISLNSAPNNTISNNTLHDIMRTIYGGFGVYAVGTSLNNTISNNTISNCSFRGVYLGTSHGSTVVGNTLANPRENIYVDTSNDLLIGSNTITGGDNGINMASSSGSVVSNNTISGCVGSGVYMASSSNNTLSRNAISHCKYGIQLRSSASNTISNNTIHDLLRVNNFGGYALFGDASPHTVVENNSFSSCFRGVFLSGVDGAYIAHNRLSNLTESGPYLVYCGNSTVHDNVVNTTYNGIYVFGSPHITITDNIAHDAGRYGIIVYGYSDYSSIEGNEVYGCYQGIFLHDINFTRIRGNYAHDNSMSGMYAGNTTWCTFEQNRLERNDWGIWTRLSRHDQIRQNVAYGNFNYSYQVSFDKYSVFEDNVGTDTLRYGGAFLPWCNNTTVRNNTLKNGIYGIVLYNATHNTVEHNTLSGYRYGVIITNTTFYANAYIPYLLCVHNKKWFKRGHGVKDVELDWETALPDVVGAEHSALKKKPAHKKKPSLPLTSTFVRQIQVLKALSWLAPVTSNATQPIEPEGIFLPADENTVENNTILVDGRGAFGMIITSMGNIVRNNSITGGSLADISFGILVQGAPESSASHNTLTGNDVRGFTKGIMVAGIGPNVLSSTQISNNTMEGCGIGIEVFRLVEDVDVVSNALSSGRTRNGYGLVVVGDDISIPTNVSISSNDFDDFRVAVLVLCRAEDAVLRNNDLGDNRFGVVALGWEKVDARLNWWGSPRGPHGHHAAKAVGNVIYVPWLTSPP